MKKEFTTRLAINYSFTFEQGRLTSILKDDMATKTYYDFNSKNLQSEFAENILTEALTAMIGCNFSAFEMIYACLDKQEYQNIAIEVFKKHWNKLYNTIVADEVFGRRSSLNDINTLEEHNFFEENK